MDLVQIALPVRRYGETSRRDVWLIQPLAVFFGRKSCSPNNSATLTGAWSLVTSTTTVA